MPRSVTLLLCMERVKGGFLGKNATEKHEEIYNYLVEGICWPNWIRKRKIRFETINSLYQKVRRNLVQIELDDYVRKSDQKCGHENQEKLMIFGLKKYPHFASSVPSIKFRFIKLSMVHSDQKTLLSRCVDYQRQIGDLG